jgi:arginase
VSGLVRLVRSVPVVVLGRLVAVAAHEAGSQRIEDTPIVVLDLHTVRERGVHRAAYDALERVNRAELDGFWIHLDCDVLDDAVMPAVDYRLADGLSWDELETVLRAALETGRATGLEVTIFNPALDPTGTIARTLVGRLVNALGAP